MKKVDGDGNVIGFSILNVSKLDVNPPELILKISGIILRNIGAPANSQFLQFYSQTI